MKASNLHVTIGGYKIKTLTYNLDRTVFIGEVQDKDSMVEYITMKWNIDREKQCGICQNGDETYNIDLKGKFIASEPIPEKIKNFYTFDKNAWHCKLYKWIFGKEPHKVHPTMCPYFWIMMVVGLIFPIILLIKLTGKAGVNFMESCSTYSKRMKIKKQEAFKAKMIEKFEKMTDKEAYELTRTNEWRKYEYDISWTLKESIEEKSRIHDRLLTKLSYEQAEIRWAKEAKEREAKFEKQLKTEKKQEIRQEHIKEFKESKTSKIIGILLVIIVSSFFLYWFAYVLVSLIKWIYWPWVGYGILGILGMILLCAIVFLLFRYIIIPLFKYGINPVFLFIFKQICGGIDKVGNKISETKFPKVPNFHIVRKSRIAFAFIFLFGWIGTLFEIIVAGLIYMINFFRMGIDLINSIYKKNCPRITWTDNEKENNLNN